MNNFFFVGDKPISESKPENPKFFTHCEDHGLTRDFKQGVSFRCRPFEYGVTYHNDDFVQDFVIFNDSIYMCVVKSTTNEPVDSEDWLMVITKGEQGIQGEKGDIGPKGEKGEKGDKGDGNFFMGEPEWSNIQEGDVYFHNGCFNWLKDGKQNTYCMESHFPDNPGTDSPSSPIIDLEWQDD